MGVGMAVQPCGGEQHVSMVALNTQDDMAILVASTCGGMAGSCGRASVSSGFCWLMPLTSAEQIGMPPAPPAQRDTPPPAVPTSRTDSKKNVREGSLRRFCSASVGIRITADV